MSATKTKKRKSKKYIPAHKRYAHLYLDFLMNYDLGEVARLKAEQCLPEESEHTCTFSYDEECTLSQCLSLGYISSMQTWFYRVVHEVLDPSTNEVYEIENTFNLPKMTYTDLRDGSKITIDRGDGIKTRWKGMVKETTDLFKLDKYKHFHQIKSIGYVSCYSTFPFDWCYQEYLRINSNHTMNNFMEKNGFKPLEKSKRIQQ